VPPNSKESTVNDDKAEGLARLDPRPLTEVVGQPLKGFAKQLNWKVNSGPGAEAAYRRYQLFRQECERRGLRFVPAQVLRVAYANEGLL
jgi:hypothetical protein